MSDLDRNYASPFGRAAGRIDAAAVDAGLRAYMLRIYNYMSIGLAITGLAALGVYMAAVTTDQAGAAARLGNAFLTPFGYAMYVSPLKWLFILAPLVMVFAISFGINRLKPATAQLLFWAFAALMGVSLSSIFLVYTHTSIVRVFFITAATFGALSLWGYTTKRDISGMGSFLFMGRTMSTCTRHVLHPCSTPASRSIPARAAVTRRWRAVRSRCPAGRGRHRGILGSG